MDKRAGRAATLLAVFLLILPSFSHAIDPYSETAFRTFATVSANGSNVSAIVTYLNLSYYSKLNEDRLKAIDDMGKLFKPEALSSTSAYAGVYPFNNSTMKFTFNDNDITDSSGNKVCDPVFTDVKGFASCKVEYYYDKALGKVVWLEDTKSCGYVRAESLELYRGPDHYQPSSATITVCPANNGAISAFGPAIISVFDPSSASGMSNLVRCFPALLIAGLLLASMYYSGRDPLSLFDITTPRLPKMQSFKVKAGATPQMLRQVLRRYTMLKEKSRKDTIKQFVLLVKSSDAYRDERTGAVGRMRMVREARRMGNEFYNDLSRKLRKFGKDGLTKEQIGDLRQSLMSNVMGYRGDWNRMDSKSKERWKKAARSISHNFNIFIQSEQAMRTMQAARGGTGTGSLLTRGVNKVINPLGDAVVRMEDTGVMRTLGRVPVVRRFAGLPSKAVDVTLGYIAARRGTKALVREIKGEAIFKLGETRAGKPLYSSARKLFTKDGETNTGAGKFAQWLTGWNFKGFEDRHDLKKRKLMDLDPLLLRKMLMEERIDPQNYFYARLAAVLGADRLAEDASNASGTRAKSAKGLKMHVDDVLNRLEVERQGASKKKAVEIDRSINALNKISRILEGNPEGLKLWYAGAIERAIKGLVHLPSGVDKRTFERAAENLSSLVARENKINELIKKINSSSNQTEVLLALHRRNQEEIDALRGNAKTKRDRDEVERRQKDLDFIKTQVDAFGKLETELRGSIKFTTMEKGRYTVVLKEDIENDLANGASKAKLEEKYGKGIVQGYDIYINLHDVRTAKTHEELAINLRTLRDSIGSSKNLTADQRAQLSVLVDSISSRFSGRGKLSAKESDALFTALSPIQKISFTGKYDKDFNAMKTYVLSGEASRMDSLYQSIGKALNSRISMSDNAREAAAKIAAFGESPAAILITQYLQKKGIDAKFLFNDKGEMVIKNANSLEILFNEGYGGARASEFRAALQSAFFRKTPEQALKEVLQYANRGISLWVATQYAVEKTLSGDLTSLGAAYRELYTKPKIRTEINNAIAERANIRNEKGYSSYEMREIDRYFALARVFEKLGAQAVASQWAGTSRGENVLWLHGQTKELNRDSLNRYGAMFYNLIDSKSIYYDKNFAEQMLKSNISAATMKKDKDGIPILTHEAFTALVNRGVRWTDIKNGLSFTMSTEGRAIPMIEWDRRFMGGKGITVLRPEYNSGVADIRDLGAVYARTPASNYSSRETGAVILRNIGTESAPKWVFSDPKKAWGGGIIEGGAGDKNIDLRKGISNALIGYDEKTGAYDPGKATFRVFSVKDFANYAKDKKYDGTFGDYSKLDRARESLRSFNYGMGMKMGEYFYGALSNRADRLTAWYDAQAQVRFALQRRTMDEGGWMAGGKDRFTLGKIEDEAGSLNTVWRVVDSEVRKGENRISANKLDHVERAINGYVDANGKLHLGEAQRLEKGDDSIAGNMRAAYYNWRRGISSNTLKEIAAEESKWYAAKTELRALETLGAGRLGLTGAEYEQLHNAMAHQLDDFRKSYKAAKSDWGEMNKITVSWVGSHGDIYNPQRNLATMGLLGSLLDSRYVAGQFQDYFNITESSVMRDPRVAIGAGAPGFDWTFYVGYHTGQNVYERSRFWATSSIWERNMHIPLGIVYPVHKWWNDKISFVSRASSGYAGPIESDMMYAPHYKAPNYLSWMAFPFESKTYSNFWAARRQSFVDFTGLGHVISAYQGAGSSERGGSGRGAVRTYLDEYGSASEHYYDTPYRLASMQRYQDTLAMSKFSRAEKFFEEHGSEYQTASKLTIGEARTEMLKAFDSDRLDDFEKYKKEISDVLGNAIKARDKRGSYIRDMLSGDDMSSDGSRGRFLEMYTFSHSNIWSPYPGLHSSDPITNELHGFSRIQRRVYGSPENSRAENLKTYYVPEFDEKTGAIKGYVDKLTTFEDAISQNYLEDNTSLLQLARRQSKTLAYSPLNVQSLAFYNPLYFGLGRAIYKNAIKNTSLGSTLTDVAVKEGIYGGQGQLDTLVESNTGYMTGKLMPKGPHAADPWEWDEAGTYKGTYLSRLSGKVGQRLKHYSDSLNPAMMYKKIEARHRATNIKIDKKKEKDYIEEAEEAFALIGGDEYG
ncbi:Uncharacterised protein [uncultured archaeon]|nr:Uncharacterised protein [uncultured archaeon]